MRCEYRRNSIGLPNGTGPFAIDSSFQLPDMADPEDGFVLQAWISNFGGCNVHLFNDAFTLADCQQRMEQGFVDMLMTLPSAGIGEVWLPPGSNKVTAFFEGTNASGQTQVVTMRVLSR